jgi:hypothetical protein
MNEFEKAAASHGRRGFLADYWYYLHHNKKWLLGTLVFLMAFLGILTLLGETAAAPFIYSLF